MSEEELAARLGQVKDELVHIGYRLPSLAREVEEIRKRLDPGDASQAGAEALGSPLEPERQGAHLGD